jgi:hypothetical protein
VWRKGRSRPTGTEAISGYRDLHEIGHGGFSVVYRAHQDGFDRVVAVKVLSIEHLDGAARRAFLREVKLTGRLTGHPHIVTALDSGLTSWGRPYLAMEYFEAGSLQDQLLREGPLPLTDVLRIGVKIAGALGAAHRAGVLHRDVKPQNILVSRYGEPALADFGTARTAVSMDVSPHTDALTPYHAAPEVLQGRDATPRTDVYSLGSTLFALLNGRPPFQSDSGGLAGHLLRVLTAEPPPLLRPDVPPDVLDVLRRAVAKNPDERFSDAWTFAYTVQDLQRVHGLPVTELAITSASAAGVDGGSTPAATVPVPTAIPPTVIASMTTRRGGTLELEPLGHPHPASTSPVVATGPVVATSSPAAPGEVAAASPPTVMPTPWVPAAPPPSAGVVATYPIPNQAMPYRAVPDHAMATVPIRARSGPRLPRWLTPAGIAVLAVIAVATPLAITGVSRATTTPATAVATSTAVAPTATAPTVPPNSSAPILGSSSPATEPTGGTDPASVAAMAPRAVTVISDNGTAVTLSWQFASGADTFPVVLQATRPGHPPNPLYVPTAGSTSYTVAHLDPSVGYCFQVGVILTVPSGGQAPLVAWSPPACIRGAMAQHT